MSSTDSTNQKPVAAFVGIDWADQKHAIVLRAATSTASLEHRSIGAEPDALVEWVLEVRERFASAGRILVCLEQSRGALIHFLMGYECFELYPINPKQLASYRETFRPSGAKDDPIDAELLCQLVSLHHRQLRPWHPDDVLTRKLALLCQKRRQAVDARTALSNQLKSELKQYFPLALAVLDNDLTTALAADFLLQWPNFESLKKTAPHKLRKFFYGHQSRSEQKLQARLERIQAAQPLTATRPSLRRALSRSRCWPSSSKRWCLTSLGTKKRLLNSLNSIPTAPYSTTCQAQVPLWALAYWRPSAPIGSAFKARSTQ